MVQIPAYFEHVQIVRTLEPTKKFSRNWKITWFLLTLQMFVNYGAPDIPVTVVAAYDHGLNGERSMHHWVEKFKLAYCVSWGVWLEGAGKFKTTVEFQNFLHTENSKL